MNLVFIALGGALGAVSRFLLSRLIIQSVPSDFPWATFAVNFSGSVLIGAFFVMAFEKEWFHANYIFPFFVTGFLGAFTTYSTFSLEAFRLYETGELLQAVVYVVGTTLSCLVGVLAGAVSIRSFY